MRSGLVSVSFRNLTPAEIIQHCLRARVEAIEWGGDVHVPHGDLETAAIVGQTCRENGLEIASYGSYYQAGDSGNPANPGVEDVVKTAVALGAPVIRVWAGRKSHKESTPAERDRVYEGLRRFAEAAGRSGIAVATEYHVKTLTESIEGADAVLDRISSRNFSTFWQPHPREGDAYHLESLKRVAHRPSHLHVYHWIHESERRPLAEAKTKWLQWLDLANRSSITRFALLEFFKDDAVEQFYEDAATLNEMIRELGTDGSAADPTDTPPAWEGRTQ